MTTTLHTGKLPFVESDRDALLRDFLAPDEGPATVEAVADFGNFALIEGKLYNTAFPWGMLGNDEEGDCVEAGGAHAHMLDDAEAGRPVPVFDPKSVTSDYSALTGYVPGKASTDRGTEMRAYFNYRRKTGIVDASGRRHRIGMFARLDAKNIAQVLAVCKALGKVPIGIEVTENFEDQFNAGEPFTPVAGKTSIVGGHCVIVVGILNGYLVVITWGTLALMSFDYFRQFNDEAWGYLSGAMLNPKSGLTLSGLDVEKARSYVAELERNR